MPGEEKRRAADGKEVAGPKAAGYHPPLHASPAILINAFRFAAWPIFFCSYIVFAIGKFPGTKIDRPGAAIIGAVLMIAFGTVTANQALSFVDFGTIVLLFSMMLVVGSLHLAGFFDWLTDRVAAHIQPRHFLPAVIFLSGVLSAFLVNDIICLVMTPFVLRAAKRMRLQPAPYLLATATAANIGSVATITGNPQNMLIGSYSGIRYADFLWHLGPVALAGLLLDWLILWLLCARTGAPKAESERDAPAAPAQPRVWTKALLVTLLVFAGFLAGLPPPEVAAVGAALMLMTRTREPQLMYDEVNWGLLVFFVGLFIIVGGTQNAGLTQKLIAVSRPVNLKNTASFTAVTALLSNIVSNVPAVMVLKSLAPSFPSARQGWLLLAMASTLAGNLTITGSVANIIVVERARPETEIRFTQYLRVGVPVTLVTILFGWLWLRWMH